SPTNHKHALAPDTNIIRRDHPNTCNYIEAPRPCSSLKTNIPHSNPHNWFEFDSGMPRLIPTYLAAYCWNTSPITQMNPPSINQKRTSFAPTSSRHNEEGPPV